MAAKQKEEDHSEIYMLSNQVARSTISVLETLARRGSFTVDEFLPIGQLRQQCHDIVQLIEMREAAEAAAS